MSLALVFWEFALSFLLPFFLFSFTVRRCLFLMCFLFDLAIILPSCLYFIIWYWAIKLKKYQKLKLKSTDIPMLGTLVCVSESESKTKRQRHTYVSDASLRNLYKIGDSLNEIILTAIELWDILVIMIILIHVKKYSN